MPGLRGSRRKMGNKAGRVVSKAPLPGMKLPDLPESTYKTSEQGAELRGKAGGWLKNLLSSEESLVAEKGEPGGMTEQEKRRMLRDWNIA